MLRKKIYNNCTVSKVNDVYLDVKKIQINKNFIYLLECK